MSADYYKKSSLFRVQNKLLVYF